MNKRLARFKSEFAYRCGMLAAIEASYQENWARYTGKAIFCYVIVKQNISALVYLCIYTMAVHIAGIVAWKAFVFLICFRILSTVLLAFVIIPHNMRKAIAETEQVKSDEEFDPEASYEIFGASGPNKNKMH